MDIPPLLPTITRTSTTLADVEQYFQERREILEELKRELGTTRNLMEQTANKRRSARTFAVGDQVFLKVKRFLQPAITKGSVSKFSPKYFGPYTILAKVGEVAYRLQLPVGTKIHPVFHVSLLKKAVTLQVTVSDSLPNLEGETAVEVSPLLPTIEENEVAVEPQAVLDKRVIYQGTTPITQVLIRWSHLPPDQPTWEYLPDVLKQFPCVISLL